MSNFLEKIIYLTENQYQQLVQNNQVNNNYLYITNEDGVTLDDLGLTVVDVIHGGTGCSSFTTGSVLVGNGLNPITEIIPTNTNTGDTLVKRDASGNFSANIITASLSGNATTSTSTKYVQLYEARGTTTSLNKAANYVGAGAMFHLIASSNTNSADNGKTPTDANILQMNWDNSGGYDSQLGIATGAARMYFRPMASQKAAWREVAHAPVSTQVGTATQPIYMSNTGELLAGTALGASAYHPDSYFKTTQTAITAVTAETTADTVFVSSVTQNENGEITVKTRPLDTSGTWSGNAATATEIKDAGNTAQFYRGDNTWSNIIKQTASAALGIDSNLKIGQARKDLNFDISNGSGTGINNGNAGGITWGFGDVAYAGIYYQSSGSYGSRLLFGTTSSYANGAYARMIIQNNGNVGIGTLTPDKLLTVNGTAYIHGATIINGAATFNSTVSISGATTLSSTLTVSGATTINNTLTVSGATTINNTVNVTSAATFDDNVTIAGTATIGDIIVGSGTSQNTIATNGNNLDMILSPTGKLCLYQGGSSGTAKVILNGNTFYPYTDNQVSLGIDNNAWKELYVKTIITTPAGSSIKPIYISSTTKQITESDATVGSQYQPVYLNSGAITAAYPVQYLSWTFANANDNQVVFSNQLFTASTYVLSIVVTSGESNLTGPISWETKVTNETGQLILRTNPAVTGTVSGYMLISFGADLSSTISGTSSHSNT